MDLQNDIENMDLQNDIENMDLKSDIENMDLKSDIENMDLQNYIESCEQEEEDDLSLCPQTHSQGTIFSLRSRRQQDAYLSLELGAAGSVKLVHAGPNGTQTVDVAAPVGDGEWHQLALGLHDDSSVKSYLDCAWVSTDILKRNSLDTPEDADIVIGYLFLGDLEQLVIVPTPAAVSQQCSGTRVPMVDPALLLVAGNRTSLRRRSPGRKGVDYKHLAEVAGKQGALSPSQGLDPDSQRDERNIHTRSEQNEDLFEGSGSEVNDLDNTQYGELKVTRKGSVVTECGVVRVSDPATSASISGLIQVVSTSRHGHQDSGECVVVCEEVEWSEWSECSASCGQGTQSRYSRCVDDGSRLELCMEAGEEKTESRACGKGPCRTHKKQIYKTVASNDTVMNVSQGRNTQQAPLRHTAKGVGVTTGSRRTKDHLDRPPRARALQMDSFSQENVRLKL
uniref:Thrombospondin-like N-terminal domain-containing protein n=1 Tax=Timema shepardi TaxID=629360 RepID=A0A7R9B461_TIMSH|nr:unnamed protein product [Timema shepardi]